MRRATPTYYVSPDSYDSRAVDSRAMASGYATHTPFVCQPPDPVSPCRTYQRCNPITFNSVRRHYDVLWRAYHVDLHIVPTLAA